ncbi:MAG: transporter [Solirubrobacterales bacterium]|nr:transporter [Solirubrobacterales bacterium]
MYGRVVAVAAPPSPASGSNPSSRRLALMIATCCASIAVIMGLTAGAIAVVPDIGRDLGADQSALQWATDAFPLVVAAFLLPAGALLDRWGRRLGMLVGLIILTLAVLWTGVAGSIEAVIVSRCVAGAGAALLFPGTLATITAAIPPERRPVAVGLWAISVIIGAVAGLLIFSVGVQYFSWQVPFLVFAGVSAVLFVLTFFGVPETKAEHAVSLDPVGALASIGAVGCLTFAVTEGPTHGWLAALTVGPALAGTVLLIAFVRWELRHPSPLLDVRLLADRTFGTASLALFVMFFAHFALFFLSIQYQGYVLGYSTLKNSLGVVPPVLGYALTPLGPWLARRIGRRRLIVGAMALTSIGALVAILMAVAWPQSYWTFAVGAALMWGGIGLAMAPPTEMIIEAVPPSKHGVASAVNDLARELSAAVGIAVAGSAFNTAYRASVGDHLRDLPDGVADTALRSPARALEALGGGPGAGRGIEIVRDAVVAGWMWSFAIVSAVVLAGGVVIAIRAPRADGGA